MIGDHGPGSALANELSTVLAIPDTSRTSGRNILVYDDVFTSGHTLNTVARTLIETGGANRVCGISLARQPFRR